MTATAQLPHIDEHSALVCASAGETWDALLRVVESSVSGGGSPSFARALGCAETAAGGPRPLAPGSTIPGFRVDAAEKPRELALAGRHRFSEYGLVFRLDDLGDEGTRLRAETRAEFPGLRGRLYRALVIGTRGHVAVTRRLLGATKRRAEGLRMGDVLRLGPHDSLEIRSSSLEALEVEARYRPLGSPPPPHLHPDQDEHFEVLEGAMRARVDGEELDLATGAEVDVLRGQVHQMWNPGQEPARVRWVTVPAGRTEEWFRTLDSVFGEGGAIATGREVDFAALLEEYADVFRLAETG